MFSSSLPCTLPLAHFASETSSKVKLLPARLENEYPLLCGSEFRGGSAPIPRRSSSVDTGMLRMPSSIASAVADTRSKRSFAVPKI